MSFIKKFKNVTIAVGIFAVFLTISACCLFQQNTVTDEQMDEPFSKIVDVSVQKEKTETSAVEGEKNSAPVTPESSKIRANAETQTKPSEKTGVAVVEEKKTTTHASDSAPVTSEVSNTQVESDEKRTLTCFLTVRCDTILNNIENAAPEKIQLIPENGVFLDNVELEFSEGDTVFDVLEKEMKNRKIHFEFSNALMYDSVYIEGIGNLYEFDAGDLSGWIYRVNGKVPTVGCSQYKLKNGDKIEILYTCNMGRDL